MNMYFFGSIHRKLTLLGLCFSIILAFIPTFLSAEENEMTIVHSFFEPFIWAENGKSKGVYVDVLTEALENRMGISVTFLELPWKRAQASVKRGIYDGFVTLETPERSEYSIACKVPVAVASMGVTTYVGHPRIEEMKRINQVTDLRDYRLIAYLGHGWAERYLKDYSIQFSGKDLATVLAMLDKHRGDMTVEPVEIVSYNIQKLDLKDRVQVVPGVSLSNLEFKLLISKMSRFTKHIDQLESVLLSMKEDGTFDEILNRYW